MITIGADHNILDHTQQLGTIVRSNQTIRRHVQLTVNDFLNVRDKLLDELKKHKLDQVDQLKPFAKTMEIQTLNKQVTSEKVQLALCGENSSGKTSFLHMLLKIGDILPSGVGPVTGRIIKLTYADAKNSCIRVFKSFDDSLEKSKPKVLQKIDLSSFFMSNDLIHSDEQGLMDVADWSGIMRVLEEHVQRPSGIDVRSDEFAEWARHFVEICLPSPTLRWNVDVYDTPGFLYNDADVLKEILRNLVSRVHPTLVFLYDNPATTDDTNNCYLALKNALKQSDTSNIFYLNTKADIEHMPNVTQETTMEQFKKILNEQQAARYDQLKTASCLGKDNLSGLPKSVDECNCFDICSVVSHNDELGVYMNDCAIRRLIQFVANSDLVIAKRVTSLVLPAVEAFFDLALIISHRTSDQLKQLRRDALAWHERYFSEHRKHIDTFLREVYDLILENININRDSLVQKAAQHKSKKSMESYMRLAVKHRVIKQVVSDTLAQMLLSTTVNMLLNNRDLMVNASSNELLVAALRTEESEMFATVVDESIAKATFKFYMLNTITTSTMLVAQVLFAEDENDDESIKGLLKQLQYSRSKSREKNSRNRFDSNDLILEAQQCLSDIESEIYDEKRALEMIIGLWSDHHKETLKEKIDQLYKGAEKLLPLRNKTHEIIQQYASSFARIYCHLHAAQDFAKFDGIEPIIRNNDSQSTIYTIDRAIWGKRENLLVKRLNHPMIDKLDAVYFEGQYHLKVRSLDIPYIVDICYLYEKIMPDETRDLWMFFPAFKRNLRDFMEQSCQQLSIDKALEMMSRIAKALACLHQNELVHRNVTASNIVLDENDHVYLIDLGDWNNNDENYDITKRHDPSATQNGTNDDIRALGQLGLGLLPLIEISLTHEHQQTRLNSFKKIMDQCISASAKEPMSAQKTEVDLRSI